MNDMTAERAKKILQNIGVSAHEKTGELEHDALQFALDALDQLRWRVAEKEPPQVPGDYLAWRHGHIRPDVMRWRKNAGFDDHSWPIYGKVTHWLPISTPPEVK